MLHHVSRSSWNDNAMPAVVTGIAVSVGILVCGHIRSPVGVADGDRCLRPIEIAKEIREEVAAAARITRKEGTAEPDANLSVGSRVSAIDLIHRPAKRYAVRVARCKAGLAVEMILVAHAQPAGGIVVGGSPSDPGVVAAVASGRVVG